MIEYIRLKLKKWLQIDDNDSLRIERLEDHLRNVKDELLDIRYQLEINMAALENLTKAVTDLQNTVDATVTELNNPHPTEAQVQSAADAVQAQVARLQAALAAPVSGSVE